MVRAMLVPWHGRYRWGLPDFLSMTAELGQAPGTGLATVGTHPGADGSEDGAVAVVAFTVALVADAGGRRAPAGRDDPARVVDVVDVVPAQPASRTAPPRVSRARREGRVGP